MPYFYPDNIPSVAKNWTEAEQKKCIAAANGALSDGASEQDAIFACIHAAGKTEHPGGEGSGQTLHWVDLFDAGKVLAGEEVLLVPLMPNGYVRGGVRRPPITVQDLQLMQANFENRGTSGFYQTKLPLNKEHEPTQGKIGHIKSFRLGQAGGYATFDLTEEGRALLESGQFDYLSPEIRWETTDIVTGAVLGPSLVGAAATNYPFFGDRTAMYSDRAQERLAEAVPPPNMEGETDAVLGLITEITDILRRIGWHISDLRWVDERGVSALDVEGISAELQSAKSGLFLALAKAASALPDLASQKGLFELFAVTKAEEDGQQYPRSAYAVVKEVAEPDTWAARFKAYQGDGLVPTHELLSRAVVEIRDHEGLSGARRARAMARVFDACVNLGLDPFSMEGFRMRMPTNETPTEPAAGQQEHYAARFAELEAQMETYRAEIARRDEVIAVQGQQISQLDEQRLSERFTREAEGFRAIGAPVNELAAQLMWLYRADDSEGRAHFEWFRSLLQTADQGLSESAAFNEVGHGQQVPDGADPWRRIEAGIAALAKARGIAAREGTAAYTELMSEFMAEHPELFGQYRESVSGSH